MRKCKGIRFCTQGHPTEQTAHCAMSSIPISHFHLKSWIQEQLADLSRPIWSSFIMLYRLDGQELLLKIYHHRAILEICVLWDTESEEIFNWISLLNNVDFFSLTMFDFWLNWHCCQYMKVWHFLHLVTKWRRNRQKKKQILSKVAS